jgi:branched-chain amino acid transport system ATP-binding protein
MIAAEVPTPAIALETQRLSIHFGGHYAVDGVTAQFHSGTLTAIVGPNGAGKTTYFNLMSGQLRPTAGSVHCHGKDVTRLGPAARTHLGVGRSFQLTHLFPKLSVLENVRLAIQSRKRAGFNMMARWSARGDLVQEAVQFVESCGLARRLYALAGTLSHGDKRKLEVAILMALEPSIFMFDEPTAGMSSDEVPVILSLIQSLKQRGDKTILLVEHKMDVIRSLADRIVVLHNGKLISDGAPHDVMRSSIVQEAYLGAKIVGHV